jgi:2-polyprenyl-6-methoxyphenol hydroxylase-like FAD-dependent oxidoreductase
LVGDAAHSVYPALGQGANAALEGAATLGAVLAGKQARLEHKRGPGWRLAAQRHCARSASLGRAA